MKFFSGFGYLMIYEVWKIIERVSGLIWVDFGDDFFLGPIWVYFRSHFCEEFWVNFESILSLFLVILSLYWNFLGSMSSISWSNCGHVCCLIWIHFNHFWYYVFWSFWSVLIHWSSFWSIYGISLLTSRSILGQFWVHFSLLWFKKRFILGHL